MDALNRSRRRSPRLALLLPVVAAAMFAGCSLVVMTQKMLFGDPTITCAFRQATKIDLVGSGKKVVVVCTVPAAVESQYPSVASDILEQITLHLKREGVKVVSADKVQEWFDDNNRAWTNADDLAEAFQEADIAFHIELTEFTHKAENSPQLLQGNTRGFVRAYRLSKEGGKRRAREIYVDEDFHSTYPEHSPTPANRTSSGHFLRQYIKRISTQLAQRFYDHVASETVY